MPTRRGLTGSPRDQLLAGEWPHGRAKGPAAVAQELARALATAAEAAGLSVRQLAREADLQHTTVLGLLNGTRWPDFVTVVKLEDALGLDLWPRRFDG